MKPLIENKVYGDYECTHLLGISSHGAVYRANHVDDDDALFALRTLQIHSKNIDYVVQECNEYMESLKSIQAPNVIPMIDYGHLEEEYYVVMPFVDGITLRNLIKQNEKENAPLPSLGEIYNFAQAICDALQSLNDIGLAHGAIQPRNILLTVNHEVFLADMGLARLIKLLFSLENTGSFFTGRYTAPEVWDGERISLSTDLYSLACVLYHLVTGRAPFDGKTIFDQMEQHKNAIVQPPHYFRKDAPFALTMFFLTATAKTPPERFRSIQEFLYEFNTAIVGDQGEPTTFFDISPYVDMDDT